MEASHFIPLQSGESLCGRVVFVGQYGISEPEKRPFSRRNIPPQCSSGSQFIRQVDDFLHTDCSRGLACVRMGRHIGLEQRPRRFCVVVVQTQAVAEIHFGNPVGITDGIAAVKLDPEETGRSRRETDCHFRGFIKLSLVVELAELAEFPPVVRCQYGTFETAPGFVRVPDCQQRCTAGSGIFELDVCGAA